MLEAKDQDDFLLNLTLYATGVGASASGGRGGEGAAGGVGGWAVRAAVVGLPQRITQRHQT